MSGTPLIMGPAERLQLDNLRTQAAEHVVDMLALTEAIKTKAGKRRHMEQMNRQSVFIPLSYMVTYSVESGHPAGPCRHMSMSTNAAGRVPSIAAVEMIAKVLGFVGDDLSLCHVYPEDLQRGESTHAVAINVIQPLNVHSAVGMVV